MSDSNMSIATARRCDAAAKSNSAPRPFAGHGSRGTALLCVLMPLRVAVNKNAADHSENARPVKGPLQGRPHAVAGQVAAAGRTAESVEAPSSKRTATLSVAPEASITVTRAKPGPSGRKKR